MKRDDANRETGFVWKKVVALLFDATRNRCQRRINKFQLAITSNNSVRREIEVNLFIRVSYFG